MDSRTPENPGFPLEVLKTSAITNPETRAIAETWLAQRNLNRGCYSLIPESEFETRPAEGFTTPRVDLSRQIMVHDNFLKCVREGSLEFGRHYSELRLDGLSKNQLLEMWDNIDRQIIAMLASESRRSITVPWKDEPVSAAEASTSLRDNEIYHIQKNRGMLRFLGIQEFEELRRMWG